MPLLDIKNVSKKYGEKTALHEMAFQVNEGEIVALIGKNGAGKTTLLNSIAGIIFPSGGEIFYKGRDLLKDNGGLSEFGILITGCFLDYLNTFDNLSLLMRASGVNDTSIIKERIDEVLHLVGLENQKKKRVKSFSFGMKQRLGLAQTLLTKTGFLILDEPFVGLDPLGKDMLKRVIIQKAREEKVGVLFSSHDLTDVTEICDRVVMIEGGRKVYDDVFDGDKRYCLTLSSSVDFGIMHRLKALFESVSITGHSIEFKDVSIFSGVMKFLVENNVLVTDVQVKENSLYDFFAEEQLNKEAI